MRSPLHVSLSHRWKRSQDASLAASLTNRLALHLESDFGVTTVSGKVSEWAGQEGFRNTVVQATDANRPTLVPNVLDGHPAIRFGGSHWLAALAQIGVVAGDFPRIYVVGSFASAGTSYDGAQVSYDNTSVINRGFIAYHFALQQGFNVHRGGASRSVATPTALGSNSIPHLYDGRNDPTSLVLSINGIERASGSVPAGSLTFTPDNISIGRAPDNSLLLSGDIFCVIVVNNETDTSHQTIMSYLKAKYPSLGLGTPKGILGPLLHADFDAADPNIVLNGSNVSSIPNRGTDTAAMVQATAANQPVYSATSFAGGPGMTFDGVDDTMACTLAAPIPAGRRPYMWVVFKANSSISANQLVADVEGASGGRFLAAWTNRGGSASFGAVASLSTAPIDLQYIGTSETSKTHLFEVGATVGGVAAYCLDGAAVNGTPGANFVPLDLALNAVRLASYMGTSQFSSCTIRRIIVANDLPSAAQITAMREYLLAQPYGLPQQKPPLPASAIEYWHSELQCTPSAWVGQIAGRTLVGQSIPTVATDPGFFNGRVVAQANTTGNKAWLGSGFTGMPALGTHPWAMVVSRQRTILANQVMGAVGTAALTESQIAASATNFLALFSGSGALISTVAVDTLPHRMKAWRDGTNKNVKVDETLTSAADTFGSTAVDTVSIGTQVNAAGGFASVNVAFFILCRSKPTAAEEAALDAWAQAYWGVP